MRTGWGRTARRSSGPTGTSRGAARRERRARRCCATWSPASPGGSDLAVETGELPAQRIDGDEYTDVRLETAVPLEVLLGACGVEMAFADRRLHQRRQDVTRHADADARLRRRLLALERDDPAGVLALQRRRQEWLEPCHVGCAELAGEEPQCRDRMVVALVDGEVLRAPGRFAGQVVELHPVSGRQVEARAPPAFVVARRRRETELLDEGIERRRVGGEEAEPHALRPADGQAQLRVGEPRGRKRAEIGDHAQREPELPR
jgi:hypothetical protein